MSKRTPEIADEICERIANGEPLRQICRDEHMPHWTGVYDWIANDESFALRIARARELGFDAIAESCIEIAEDGTNDWMEKHNADGDAVGWVLNGEHVQRSKLRVETRLKLLAKWAPKKYGDRQAMELTGADGGPVQITDTERAAKIAAILAAAKSRKDGGVDDLV